MKAEIEITPEDIRARAYDLWERLHRPEGHEIELWLLAERELKAERQAGRTAIAQTNAAETSAETRN
ncbi:DUF2934 domain-containing protein [Methylobacterium sp. ID0610]|uniref:DUF2934 domain-containing protein n=1 Tax=Methylobacterium carpenticola TaxID=3344827 RepID=UPI003689C897